MKHTLTLLTALLLAPLAALHAAEAPAKKPAISTIEVIPEPDPERSRFVTAVTVAPGTFQMGAEPGSDYLKPLPRDMTVTSKNPGARKLHTGVDAYQGPQWDERPVHKVTISSAFEISRRVTLGEFLRYKPEHAEVYISYGMKADPTASVTRVTWDEAQGYCQWLGTAEGSICRLLTEAEWEYAASNASASGLEGLGDWTKEWCHDWWSLYVNADETDPLGPAEGIVRVIRGRVDDLGHTRITDRSGGLPGERLPDVSFRVARVRGTSGQYRTSPPPDAVFQNVSQKPKQWKPVEVNTPVFHGGQWYIDKFKQSNFNAADLPYWGRHHVPKIVWCDNGDLLVTVMTAANDPSDQMAVLITRLRDGAENWDPPARFFIMPDSSVCSAVLHRADDGTLYHFNWMGDEKSLDVAARRVSRDNGATWSQPEIVRFHLSDERDDGFKGFMFRFHLDIFRLNDGAIVMPRDIQDPLGTALFKSIDGGMSWYEMTRSGWQTGSFGKKGEKAGWIAGLHGAVAVLRDGSFMAIGRENNTGGNIDGRSPISRSSDNGRTWTYGPSQFSPVAFSQQPIIIRLAEGPLMVLHFTDSTAKRGKEDGIEVIDAAGKTRRIVGAYTALSFDEGATWSHHKLLPLDAKKPYESSMTGMYSAVQSPDGMIHLVSSSLYWRFNLAWLMAPMVAVPEPTTGGQIKGK